MGSTDETGARAAAGGQGRLAQVIATRGGKAAPEAPFVIEHREALIYMLCEAAEVAPWLAVDPIAWAATNTHPAHNSSQPTPRHRYPPR